MKWPTCWTSSCEEAELYDRVAKFLICLYLTLLLSFIFVISIMIELNLTLLLLVIFVISIVIELNLTLLLLVIFVISIVIELNLPLLLSVICYLIVSNFTASSILSYVLCDGLSETPKNRGLVYFHSHAFIFFSIKCNLGYKLCSGCKPFLIIFA